MTCNSRCWSAKTDKDKCKCSCNGSNHGKAHQETNPDSMHEIILTEEEAKPYRKLMTRRTNCWDYCGYKDLHKLPIYGYTHQGGWNIRGGKYWLYIECPNCDYGWSIWKFGVPRDFDPNRSKEFLDMGDYL